MRKINKIYFLLPGTQVNKKREYVPVGGYKVIYEYANLFAQAGFNVVLAYSHARCHYRSIWKYIYSFCGYYYRKLRHQVNAGTYFTFDKNVTKEFCYRFSSPWFRLGNKDIAFATAYETAQELNAINNISQNRKYYFIQGYETWAGSEEEIQASYKLGMTNITIAPWLTDIVNKSGAKAICVTNGFNFKEFYLMNDIDKRDCYHVIMLNHILEHKRCKDAWAALEIVKKAIPQLHVTMFGTYPAPTNMPSWYEYHQNPTKKELNSIYNQGAIYIAASDFEGFGLTIGEAMICGCAIACTNNGGFKCMAKQEETALLSDIYDVKGMADNIKKLILDETLRIKIAKKGNEYIKNFSWEKSFDKMLQIILK